jgi:WD40 repeat protein
VTAFSGHSDWVSAVAVLADGRQIVSAGQEGVLHLWETSSGDRIASLHLDAAITAVAHAAIEGGEALILVGDEMGNFYAFEAGGGIGTGSTKASG